MTPTSPYRSILTILLCIALVSAIACKSKNADDSTATDGVESTDSVTAETDEEAQLNENEEEEAEAESEDVTGKKGMVSTKENSDLRIRALPDIASSVLGKIPNKTTVDIVGQDVRTTTLDGEKGRWLKVKYNNIEGWVWGNFIVLE